MAETRKLVAILAADVVGYSRLAGADEDRTLARLRALRSDLIDPTAQRTASTTLRNSTRLPSPVPTNFSRGPDVGFRGEAEVAAQQRPLPRSKMTHLRHR